MIPTDGQVRVPDLFPNWMTYPATLDIGSVTIDWRGHSIGASWSKASELNSLPRFEVGDRFARLVFVIQWAPGRWVAIHGEHMRKQGSADETGGATLETWVAPDVANHTTLGQTMKAKSKDSQVQASDYEPSEPIGIMVVTHDQNSRPQRTPIHWFGFGVEAGGGGGGMAFPGHPYPQIFYGPQVDRLRGTVSHWVDFRARHGFHGILIPCANLPLDNTGIKALVGRMPWTLIRLFGDEQHGQVPAGGILGAEAQRYYNILYRLLGEFGPEKWGVTVGFDPFEWVTFEELRRWVKMMQGLDPHVGRMIGARAQTRDDDPPNPIPNPGTYKSWAVRCIDKSQFRRQLREIVVDSGSTFPVCAEDGFRERPGGRSKDWTEKQMIEQGFCVALDEGVAATWARFNDEGGEDGCIDWSDPDLVKLILGGGDPPPPDRDPKESIRAMATTIEELAAGIKVALADL